MAHAPLFIGYDGPAIGVALIYFDRSSLFDSMGRLRLAQPTVCGTIDALPDWLAVTQLQDRSPA
jgi:hypothetical protein